MAINLYQFKTEKPIFTTNSNNPNPTHKPSSHAPNIVAVSRTDDSYYWASIESDVESYLKKAIPIRSPEAVFEPMRHLTFAAPKTTASALCVAACEFVGGDRSQAMAAASAIHLMHAAAHTHERLISTDRLKVKPEPPRAGGGYGPNIELLTGDGIIPFGLELLARSVDLERADPDRVRRVIVEIARACGSRGVVDGQCHGLGLEGLEGEVETIAYACKKKGGELHACGAACGAVLGGGSETEIEKLRSFGLCFGTVQGMIAKDNPRLGGKIEELKEVVFKEMDSFFKGSEFVELISSIFELNLVKV